jgi:hypothetical protein
MIAAAEDTNNLINHTGLRKDIQTRMQYHLGHVHIRI